MKYLPYLPKLRKAQKQIDVLMHTLVDAKHANRKNEHYSLGMSDLIRRAEALRFDLYSLTGVMAAQECNCGSSEHKLGCPARSEVSA